MPAFESSSSRDDALEPVQNTHQYIEKHKLSELFGHLLQLVLYHRPDNPRTFLAEEVRKIREEKASSSLFSERDLETMFEMIDVTSQRWISVAQLRNTCRNLATASSANSLTSGGSGLTVEQEAVIAAAGDAAGRVTLEKFKEILSALLFTKNMWS